MIDDMHLGLVTLHILYHAKEEELKPGWMADELDKHGYEYDRKEVDRVMKNLVARGLLDTDEDKYWATNNGIEFFKNLKKNLKAAEKEIIQE
ncbi:MAG: hypothetical protein SVV03_01565 [Candidatus Nanohaloarchaea archaeon]|nr:hypothetical protein [Candidatus Nanohaloarchaea archaeon]